MNAENPKPKRPTPDRGDVIQITLRVSDRMHAELKAAAQAKRRTLTAEIIERLGRADGATPVDLITELREVADRIERATLPPEGAQNREDTQRRVIREAIAMATNGFFTPDFLKTVTELAVDAIQHGPDAWAFRG